MTERTHTPRRPTVTSPAGRTAWHAQSPMLAWLKRESLALLAVAGAAVTVLAQLGNVMPLAPEVALPLARWQELTRTIWRPPLDLAGIAVHHDVVAALNVVVFMTLLGAGARLSAHISGKPLAPLTFGRFFDDQTWPSLIVFAALTMIFLVGNGASSQDVLTVWGSKELGKYAFAILVSVGYFAGDFIGHREFHLRLYRLAVIVAALVAANLALVYFQQSARDGTAWAGHDDGSVAGNAYSIDVMSGPSGWAVAGAFGASPRFLLSTPFPSVRVLERRTRGSLARWRPCRQKAHVLHACSGDPAAAITVREPARTRHPRFGGDL